LPTWNQHTLPCPQLLAVLLLSSAACESSTKATDPARPAGGGDEVSSALDRMSVWLPRALGEQTGKVLEADEIRVDQRPVALMARFERGAESHAGLCLPGQESCVDLGRADRVAVGGLVDLAAEQPLPLALRSPEGLRSGQARRPALLLVTRSEREVSLKGRGAKAKQGLREEKVLHIVGYRGRLRVLLRLEQEVNSGDGFGGFSLKRPALFQREGKTYIEAMRQDRLDASRARCVMPAPYLVRYQLDGDRFRELPTDPPAETCP